MLNVHYWWNLQILAVGNIIYFQLFFVFLCLVSLINSMFFRLCWPRILLWVFTFIFGFLILKITIFCFKSSFICINERIKSFACFRLFLCFHYWFFNFLWHFLNTLNYLNNCSLCFFSQLGLCFFDVHLFHILLCRFSFNIFSFRL
jgi:hypothetical protein